MVPRHLQDAVTRLEQQSAGAIDAVGARSLLNEACALLDELPERSPEYRRAIQVGGAQLRRLMRASLTCPSCATPDALTRVHEVRLFGKARDTLRFWSCRSCETRYRDRASAPGERVQLTAAEWSDWVGADQRGSSQT